MDLILIMTIGIEDNRRERPIEDSNPNYKATMRTEGDVIKTAFATPDRP
jgi:hypothetical protein